MCARVGGLKDESRMMRVLHFRGAVVVVVVVGTSVNGLVEAWKARRALWRRGSMVWEDADGSEVSGIVSMAVGEEKVVVVMFWEED